MANFELEPLGQAAQDLRYLLGRGYPRELGLKLTGDRWGLDADQRQVLRRGVLAPELARARRERLLPLAALKGRAVGVDGHNVIITLESALTGAVLVEADDGPVRDIGQRGRNYGPGPHTEAAARLMIDALAEAGAARAVILLHAPLPFSGQLAGVVRQVMERAGLAGQASAVTAPEKELAAFEGIVVSGDGPLIDTVSRPLDLAGAIIRGMEPCPQMISLETA
ncbi:MAG: DUF434 domain-containing protein [Desulfarculaceae bacterium]|nr:DUF434 domain-containing protein [Desulfarculaceae bacterium]MCF8049378.1 DUF434 domain-containing protein [Desulfarculaceae bacterium]MCF8066448.1 DUF434 domain-containing protein [Desulfarculaceae bacterium]MCF8099677.1 DUF434 domain-containing protein [Desulfarculaceae bacterium]MCF8124025.1 DUF434 domain-containing protein [Desulfarculaceae bacterium]